MSVIGNLAPLELDQTYSTILYNMMYLIQFRLKKFYMGDDQINE